MGTSTSPAPAPAPAPSPAPPLSGFGFLRRFGVINFVALAVATGLVLAAAFLIATRRVPDGGLPIVLAALVFAALCFGMSAAAGRTRLGLFIESVEVPPLPSPFLGPSRTWRAGTFGIGVIFLATFAYVLQWYERPLGAALFAALAAAVLVYGLRAVLGRPERYLAITREGLEMVHGEWFWTLGWDNVAEIRLGGSAAGTAVLFVANDPESLVRTARRRGAGEGGTGTGAGTGAGTGTGTGAGGAARGDLEALTRAALAVDRDRRWFGADVVVFDASLPESARVFFERCRLLVQDPRTREGLPAGPVFLP